LKVSANVRITIQYFENFGGANAPNAPPGCAPTSVTFCLQLYSEGVATLSSTGLDLKIYW